MANFSSKEMESQNNLIEKLLSDRIKYEDALEVIKNDLSYMPFDLKKKLEEEKILL